MLRQLLERNLIGTVRQGTCRIVVDFHEDSIATDSHGGAGQYRRQFSVATGFIPSSTRSLHRMSGVEDDVIPRVAHPIQGSHISDQVVVAKCRSAFSEAERGVAKSEQFFGNVSHIPRGEKLTFLYVDGPAGFSSRAQQVGLPTKKRGYLQQIDPFSRYLSFVQ